MDRLTPEQRHLCMSRVRSENTAPEWTVRRLVHALGFRYRLHVKDLPGKPDLVLPRHRKAIFVHGCFWHGHGCRIGGAVPATHKTFWREKFARNVARDQKALRALWQAGWQVLVVWECETRDTERLRAILAAFLSAPAAAANYALADQHALYGSAAEVSDEYGAHPHFTDLRVPRETKSHGGSPGRFAPPAPHWTKGRPAGR